jgi:undecaprenyl-diphosphatase
MISLRLIGAAYDNRRMRRVGIYTAAGAALLFAVLLAAVGWGEEPGALTDWQAFVLGIVQGLTEFLPISSSGHLILVPWLADWTYLQENDEYNQTFDVALHLGTLVAVVLYFRRDIAELVVAWFGSVRRRSLEEPAARLAWLLVVATIPAGLAGALGESFIAEQLGEPWQIAILLAVFGVVLWIADRSRAERRMGDLGLRDALIIGAAQILALAPGVSRSGITISAARFLRLDRDAAARFSFLLLVPTILGAVVWKGVGDVVLGDLPEGWTGPFLVGTIAAAVSGLFAIWALLGYVRRRTYSIFVVYRLIAAAIVLLLIATGVREATF